MKQGIIVVNKGTMDFDVRMKTIDDFVLSMRPRYWPFIQMAISGRIFAR